MKRIDRLILHPEFSNTAYLSPYTIKGRRYVGFQCDRCKIGAKRRLSNKQFISLCSNCLREYNRNQKLTWDKVMTDASTLMQIRTRQMQERNKNANHI